MAGHDEGAEAPGNVAPGAEKGKPGAWYPGVGCPAVS